MINYNIKLPDDDSMDTDAEFKDTANTFELSCSVKSGLS